MDDDEEKPREPVDRPSGISRVWRTLFGAPRDVSDPRVFHKISLIAFLAWVGLGSDGLSSSAYGPAEAFKNLIVRNPITGKEEGQFYLAVFLAVTLSLTVFIISYAYSRVIEQFPHGGGGYVVATKLLGRGAGVVSGSALLVDYVLTITTSVVGGGDAIFDLLPQSLRANLDLKVGCELVVLLLLVVMNLRGIKESVQAVMPVFLVFIFTHFILVGGGFLTHIGRVGEVVGEVGTGVRHGLSTFGKWGLFVIFVRAFSLGGSSFTGIEAVSNGISIMREPKVHTGKKTMLYMAASLAFTAGGILFCYLLFHVQGFFDLPAGEQVGKTLNGILAEKFAGAWHVGPVPIGTIFIYLTLASEAALLFLAAQTGFIDGPRVMANMAIDSWLPHRFASLSDRLTTKDGVLLMGAASIAVLIGTVGNIDTLVVMYSINVFVTFSLTEMGMCRFWFTTRKQHGGWIRHISVHVIGLTVCLTILTVTVIEKFSQGAWKTLLVTAGLIAACVWVRAHYRSVALQLRKLDHEFHDLPGEDHHGGEPDPKRPTAVLLVGGFGGVGVHSLLSIQRMFPGFYKNVVFVSVAVVDSGHFKGVAEIEAQKRDVGASLAKYVQLARRLGWNADSATSVGTDPVDEIYRVCVELAHRYPQIMFFGGKLIWKRESWWQRILHNETAHQVQRRLQWKGLPMTVIPLRAGDGAPPRR